MKGEREDRVVARYLERHGSGREDERRRLFDLARRTGPFDAALVIPVRDEAPVFLARSGLSQIRDQRLLVIVVVNGPHPRAQDRQLLDDPPSALSDSAHELAVLDRVSPHRAFGPRDGVGLARKIGLDLALELWRRGQVHSPWLHSTDADATLPTDHFVTDDLDADPSAVARVARFWHDTAAAGPVELATAHYEIWMRYYVAGLAHAGSPYAFDALGSCISVHAQAYARAGGVPRRQAGEDFHLLAKLAKLGTVHRSSLDRAPVSLRCRTSSRVPFGTGPGVSKLMATLDEGDHPRLHDPKVFDAVAGVLSALDDTERALSQSLSRLPEAVGQALARGELLDALERASRSATTPEAVRRRRHECFDALRTLQMIHALRDFAWPDLIWRDALRAAPFSGPASAAAGRHSALDAVRGELERATPGRAGQR